MKIVALSFFLCSCISLGLFKVGSLAFCSLFALFFGPVVDFRILSAPADFLSIGLFLLISLHPSSTSCLLPLTCSWVWVSFTVLENRFLTKYRFVHYLSIGLLTSCRSIAFLSVYFLPASPFPALWYVSFTSVCFQSLTLLRIHSSIACLSVCFLVNRSAFCSSDCFLTIGLFPVHESVSELSVCFLSFASAWSACRPVSCPLAYFQFFCLFPVHQKRSVSSSSLSFKFIDMFYVNRSVILHQSISCPLLPVHWSISCLPVWPCQSVCVPIPRSVFGPLVCFLSVILTICRVVFCPFICYVACWNSVFPVNCLYPGYLSFVLFSVRWKFFKSLYQYSCSR